MAKSVLIICQQAPWHNISVKETLDLALAGGAFELPISLLFLDDGVWQLVKNQDSQQIEQKDLTANLQALSLFGIDELLVAEHSLTERSLTLAQLTLSAKVITKERLAKLLIHYDVVITN